MDNFAASPYCVYPCEPNWIYPVCNLYGINAVASYDLAFGTRHVERVRADFEKGLVGELMRPDGSIHAFRSKWTGLAVPAADDIGTLGGIALMAAPVFPTLARRLWAILREEKIVTKDDGSVEFKLEGAAMLDAGNYKMTGALGTGFIATVAREYGDHVVAEAALEHADKTLEPVVEDGVLSYKKASNMANALLVQGRIAQAGDWKATVTKGPPKSVLAGPVLTGAAYPDVLVARAFSDGEGLDLVLYPGRTPGRFELTVERLRPNSTYQMEGAETLRIVADAAGVATFPVGITARTPLRLRPATA